MHRVETLAEGIVLHPGDCLDVLKSLAADSVDACVSDPPYGLEFMGKEWDAPWQVSSSSALFGKRQTKMPGWGVTRNPTCKRCGGRLRGAKKCSCETPKWDEAPNETRLRQMSAFQDWCQEWAEQVYRVLKPGGHVLIFGGTRTYHRMACAIEDAGFEIRDCIQWLYGSGFPKSLDVSKAIDKARDDREAILQVTIFVADAASRAGKDRGDIDAHMGTSDMAGWWTSRLLHRCQCPKWDQWLQIKAFLSCGDAMDAEVWRLNGRKGTPGEAWQSAEVLAVDQRMNEPSGIVAAGRDDERVEIDRLIKAANSDAARQWSGYGTALKPACEPIVLARKPLSESTIAANVLKWGTGALNIDGCRVASGDKAKFPVGIISETEAVFGGGEGRYADRARTADANPSARWPANVIHDGSDEVVGAFPETSAGAFPASRGPGGIGNDGHRGQDGLIASRTDEGSAARFFYTAKADSDDRLGSKHPTVKPLDLMQYLVRLVTPPKGLCLDPFAGTGTTGEAAWREGMRAVLIEREQEYQDDIRRRMRLAMCGPDERSRESMKARNKDKPVDHGPLFGAML